MHVRAFAIKNFFWGLYPGSPLLGEEAPGRGREGTADEEKGGQGKGGDGRVVERRRGGEGWKGEERGWGRTRREVGEGIVVYHF
jgi:hypothetical protein